MKDKEANNWVSNKWIWLKKFPHLLECQWSCNSSVYFENLTCSPKSECASVRVKAWKGMTCFVALTKDNVISCCLGSGDQRKAAWVSKGRDVQRSDDEGMHWKGRRTTEDFLCHYSRCCRRLRDELNKANHKDDRIFKAKWGNNESSLFIKVQEKRFLSQLISRWDIKAAFNKRRKKI